MYPWYRESVAAAAAAGLGGPVGVVGSGFCSTAPGQGPTTIKTESGYSDCMLALDYVQSKTLDWWLSNGRAAGARRWRGVAETSQGDWWEAPPPPGGRPEVGGGGETAKGGSK
ncbi:hypothetical protein PV325_004293 [Microctonus aethiopoides]|nr:hypothetical protein PV325_004293 [Microctonus aethiopoides]